MFLHDSHLPQLLTPGDYTSPEQHQRELDSLFLPGWHLVGTASDLKREGDYLTTELFGYPLLVWRKDGSFHTFLNVCPHRFSRISGAACGHAREHLRCQYHGWEFDCDGHTRKIPDARSFKPMTRGALGLRTFRTETVGQLVFTTLNADAPPLKEYLGPGYDVAASVCSADRRLAATLDYEVAANWKCKCENSLESYHVDMVHPATFGRTPDAELCAHELHDGWTTFTTVQKPQNRVDAVLDRIVHKLARVEPDDEYKHWHFYPHLMFGKMRLFSWIEATVPVAPDRARVIGKFFCYGGTGGLRSRLLSKALARWERGFFTKLADEDTGIMTEVQRGLGSTRQPSSGVISIREERCWHFQQFIRNATQPGSTDLVEPRRHEGTETDMMRIAESAAVELKLAAGKHR